MATPFSTRLVYFNVVELEAWKSQSVSCYALCSVTAVSIVDFEQVNAGRYLKSCWFITLRLSDTT